MKYILFLPVVFCLFLSSCASSSATQATLTAIAHTATAAAWTRTFTTTPTKTSTSTHTPTPSITNTPTITETPTITPTFTITLTPTFDFPDVEVVVDMASCRYGPHKAYLYHYTLYRGDKGVVWGRSPYNEWLYVKMDNLGGPCWVHPSLLKITGDVKTVLPQRIRLPGPSVLYNPPRWVEADRYGTKVIVYWEEVWMTEDDDRGYFLDVWVCQGGKLVWTPVALPNQYTNEYTFTDEPGCAQPSGGKLYLVEKHGYSLPVDIPWPPFEWPTATSEPSPTP
ncbi:MAG: hypothetical protein N2049_11680 [Anaerolineales bacterium]|nr:hypothetical protein [Anaerolineales bacterium]MCX7609859.1 hypothetical protein [Anaerolineales bacterium]MDW8226820.1 hypothetical protein [Anaerolineales bacterium]